MSVRASIAGDTVTPRAPSAAGARRVAGGAVDVDARVRGGQAWLMVETPWLRTATRRGPGVPVLPHQGEDRDAVPAARSRAAQRPPQAGGRRGARLRRHLQLVRRAASTTWSAWRPAIVGISAMVSLTGNALRVAAAVRERLPGALLVAGGPLPTVFPDRFLPHVDVVFRGEADVSFPAFCRDYLDASASRRRRSATCRSTDYAGLVARRRRRCAWTTPPVHHSQERDRRLSRCPTAATSTTAPTSASGRADRLPADLAARDAGLSVRLRVLLQAGLRQRRPPPPARRRHRRDRRHRAPRATTACGSPTTPSRSTATTSRSSAGAWRRSA